MGNEQECVVTDYDDNSLYEAIELHNEHVDKIETLGRLLLDKFDEDDPVIDAFCDVFNSMAGAAILLCCEGTSREAQPVWMTTTDFRVVEG